MSQTAQDADVDPRDWDRWPCLCPDAYRENGVRIDDCPRCTLGPNLEAALQRDHQQESARFWALRHAAKAYVDAVGRPPLGRAAECLAKLRAALDSR